MIKSLQVSGLNGRMKASLDFHADINVFTGKNGSGKTTLLKMLWYLLSGNLARMCREMRYESLAFKTQDLTIESEWQNDFLKFRWSGSQTGEIEFDLAHLENNAGVDSASKVIAEITGSSLFFPTFRRMEGGYSQGPKSRSFAWQLEGIGGIQAAMRTFADEISRTSHRFVTSISTVDVIELLDQKTSEVSRAANTLHVELSKSITEQIRQHSRNRDQSPERVVAADALLTSISDMVDDVTKKRGDLFKPFTVLDNLTDKILKDKSVTIGQAITFGNAAAAISSDALSAGEKQMLSFFCYNAFYRDAVIFIDEPELSLHVDWQRILFPTLLDQSTGNQFIVATHSPFIYSKYADKELALNMDRGDA